MTSQPHLAGESGLSGATAARALLKPSQWFTELRKRKVGRTAISYVLVMWLNLQIGDVIFPMIGMPDWALSLIIVVGVMGFPMVLILSWAFQITPNGIVLDTKGYPGEGDAEQRYPIELLGVTREAVQRHPTDAHRVLSLTGTLRFEDSTARVLGHLVDPATGHYLRAVSFDLPAEALPESRDAGISAPECD